MWRKSKIQNVQNIFAQPRLWHINLTGSRRDCFCAFNHFEPAYVQCISLPHTHLVCVFRIRLELVTDYSPCPLSGAVADTSVECSFNELNSRRCVMNGNANSLLVWFCWQCDTTINVLRQTHVCARMCGLIHSTAQQRVKKRMESYFTTMKIWRRTKAFRRYGIVRIGDLRHRWWITSDCHMNIITRTVFTLPKSHSHCVSVLGLSCLVLSC